MNARRRALGAGLAASITLAAVAVLWLLFWPMSLGGDFSYAVVTGDSMAPDFTTDDVVLLLRADDYDVGDVVAYRHPEIGTVLHRIVEDDGERFTLRGDNRGSADSYRPTRDEIVGRRWALIPGAGNMLREIQSPRNAALLAVAAVAFFGATRTHARFGATSTHARGRSRRARGTSASSAGLPGMLSLYRPASRNLAGGLIGLALGSAALLAVVHLTGTTREASHDIPYTETATFTYERIVEGGVYDFDTLRAPQPVFRTLLDELPLEFEYQLATAAPDAELTNVIGSYRLVAEVRRDDGWSRTFELQPTTLFAGTGFAALVSLDLSEVDRQLAEIEALTEVTAKVYRLGVIAEVNARGELAGLPFERSLEQRLEFLLTPLQLMFDAANSELELAETANVSQPALVPRVFHAPLLPLAIAYSDFPKLSAVGFGIAGSALLAMTLVTLFTWRSGEAARIRASHGHRIVEIGAEEIDFGGRAMNVDQFDDLVRVAEWEGMPIMHRGGKDSDEYFIFDRDASYHFTSWRHLADHPQHGQQQPGSLPIRAVPPASDQAA